MTEALPQNPSYPYPTPQTWTKPRLPGNLVSPPGAPSKPDFGLGGDFSQMTDSATVRDKLHLTQKQGLPPQPVAPTKPEGDTRDETSPCPAGHWPPTTGH
jgi:hypothetical protein